MHTNSRRGALCLMLGIFGVFGTACAEDAPLAEPYDWALPDGIPEPKLPQENPMTPEKVELGRWLFYDVRMSANQTQSCASCHIQALAFTDGRAQAVGSTGEVHPRGSMSLVNVVYASTFNWANPLVPSLEQQALGPLFATDPVELGMADREDELLARLSADADMARRFERAFPDVQASQRISVDTITKALAAFQRSLISVRSPYDRYIAGEREALSASAKRGLELFFGERAECFHCHGGFNFADAVQTTHSTFTEKPFHNNGLYALDESGRYPERNTGVHAVTGRPEDMGRFKAPTLRNIAVTGPYMHDGSIATLEAVVAHYERGGTRTESGPLQGDGRANPNRSEFVRGFVFTEQERADLIAFLESLTDEAFLRDPRHSDPFEAE
ncbi:MAG: MbnH family di-heme enzyme [Myxococcota bacterium]